MQKELLSSQLIATPDLQHLIKVVETTRAPQTEEDILYTKTTLGFAKWVVERLGQISPNPEQSRRGGIMIIGKTGPNNNYLVINEVGEIIDDQKRRAPEKRRKYTNVALGKIGALFINQSFISSAENLTLPENDRLRTENIDVPGGAMRYSLNGEEIVLGFSGFGTQEEDDAICLATRILLGDLPEKKALSLAELTNNQIFPQIIDYLVGRQENIPVVTK